MSKVFKAQKFKLAISVLLGICLIMVTLLWNSRLAVIIDYVSEGVKVPTDYLVITIVILLSMVIVTAIKNLVAGYTCEKVNHGIRMWYAGRYAKMNLSQLENISTGTEISKLQNEVNEITDFISTNLLQRVDDLINFVFTFSWLLIINWKLTLAANLFSLLVMVYAMYTSKIISKMTIKSRQEAGRMNSLAGSVSELFPVIKIYNAAAMMCRNYEFYVQNWETAGKKEERTRAKLMSLSAILSSVPLMLILLVGGSMVIGGTLELGTLYVFINLSGNVSGILMNMPSHIARYRRFTANVKRVNEGS